MSPTNDGRPRATTLFRSSALLGATAAAIALCEPSPASGQGLPAGDPASLGFDVERLSRARGIIQHLVRSDSLPGAVVMVARRGRVVSTFAEGHSDLERGIPMRVDNIFRLASETKILVSAAAMSLFEDGLFSLGDAVSDVLPEFASLSVVVDGDTVRAETPLTVRDLFRHTCGYGYSGEISARYRAAGLMTAGPATDWTHDLTLAAWGDRLATVAMEAEPAAGFSYGLCHDILGLYMEKVSGVRVDDLVQARVFDPLGMRDTGFWFGDERVERLVNVYDMSGGTAVRGDRPAVTPFRTPPKATSGGGGWDNPIAAGGAASTAPDLLRFFQMLLDRGTLNGSTVLGRKTADLFFTNHLHGLEDEESFWPGVGFGLGSAVVFDATRYGDQASNGTIWWAGSLGTNFLVDPEEELIVLVMVQVRPFGHTDVAGRVNRAVYSALVGG